VPSVLRKTEIGHVRTRLSEYSSRQGRLVAFPRKLSRISCMRDVGVMAWQGLTLSNTSVEVVPVVSFAMHPHACVLRVGQPSICSWLARRPTPADPRPILTAFASGVRAQELARRILFQIEYL
jgi:hypothetical protein